MSRTLAPHSLVRYNNPILVGTRPSGKRSSSASAAASTIDASSMVFSSTEQILNEILPPREWTENGQLWIQYVSSTPATTSAVIAVQQVLDSKLKSRSAKESGICPVREVLYSQCFDELIRQITINCAERGKLLLRVRDEIRMTISTYQKLYESSISFGMLRSLQAEEAKSKKEMQVNKLNSEILALQNQVEQMRTKIQNFKQRESKRKLEVQTKHREEVLDLTETNNRMKQELQQLLSIPTTQKTAALSINSGEIKQEA